MRRHRSMGECQECSRFAFLRPVPMFPGLAGVDCVVAIDMCLWCRVGWRDSRYCDAVEGWLHDRRAWVRERAQWALEWAERMVTK